MKIRVEINTKGQATVSVQGVRGPTCANVTKQLQDALGETSSVEPTEEFYDETEAEVEIEN